MDLQWSSPLVASSTMYRERLNSWASAVSQFPIRVPSRLAPFTRRIPAAGSGLKRPESDASKASRRTAASRTLIVEGARFFCSRKNRTEGLSLAFVVLSSFAVVPYWRPPAPRFQYGGESLQIRSRNAVSRDRHAALNLEACVFVRMEEW